MIHLGVLALAILSLGCGGVVDNLGRQAISGKVTLDGTPLANGAIRFEPFGVQKQTTATGTAIKDGQYSIKQSEGLPPGKYTVSITSHGADSSAAFPTDPAAAMDAAAEAAKAPPPKELIPSQYNTQTELVIEVQKGAVKEENFDLKSAKK